MQPYPAVLFDLDGTLLNTLEDLTDSVNVILRRHGFPERKASEIRSFLGRGAAVLLRASLPEGLDDETFSLCLAEYKDYYKSHMADKTKPYDGIPELLDSLRTAGIKIAVTSNKFHAAVQSLCDKYFPGKIDVAFGEFRTEELTLRRKPSLDMLCEAAEQLDLCLSYCVYVGDSEVDIQTAGNAGIDCICVSWGFRDKTALLEAGAETIVDSPQELLEKLL